MKSLRTAVLAVLAVAALPLPLPAANAYCVKAPPPYASTGDCPGSGQASHPEDDDDQGERSHRNFRGGCRWDTYHMGAITGQTFLGEADVTIVATDNTPNAAPPGTIDTGRIPVPTATITGVTCEFFINGVSQGTMCTAPNGTGITANTCRFQYDATADDFTTMCTHVAIDGEPTTHCVNGEVIQVPPQAVVDAVNAFGDLVGQPIYQLDPTTCAARRAMAPIVNGLGHPEIAYIDNDGDTSIGDVAYLDCPPYTS